MPGDFRHVAANTPNISRRPMPVDAQALPLAPTQCLQALLKGRRARLSFWIILRIVHQHCDPAHPLALLRTRRERPRGRRAADERDELAALHSITSSAMASSLSGIW